MIGKNDNITNGALNIYKEAGMSSQKVVHNVKKIVGLKKAGHAGTLDPAAEGVLPILCGKGTRLFNFLLQTRKKYIATIHFGIATDTMDRTGKIISENKNDTITELNFKTILKQFVGTILQETPMFSARHYKGKRLYKLARKGVTVQREKKSVNIYNLQMLSFNFPFAEFTIECDRGTYVRALCNEIGKSSGLGAHLHYLIRETLGGFSIEDAITLKELKNHVKTNIINKVFIPMSDIIDFMPAIIFTENELRKIAFGNAVSISEERLKQNVSLLPESQFRIISLKNELKAIGTVKKMIVPYMNQDNISYFVQPVKVL